MDGLPARTGAAALVLVTLSVSPGAPGSARPGLCAQGLQSVSLIARRYAFTPSRIEVDEGNLVKIELRTEDIAHSFTIDAYRLSKRIGPDQPVSLEFRAERAGTFPFYCNLQIDDGCRRMRGELIVRPRR